MAACKPAHLDVPTRCNCSSLLQKTPLTAPMSSRLLASRLLASALDEACNLQGLEIDMLINTLMHQACFLYLMLIGDCIW